jgi:hypothetical protein
VLGGDVGLTIGLGRHGTADLHIGKKTGIALGWAASKGWCVRELVQLCDASAEVLSVSHGVGRFAGASAQAGLIMTRKRINKKFYGKDVDPADLLSGKVKPQSHTSFARRHR